MKPCILLATYNEADNISSLLQELSMYDVCVIDDSSPDGTADICRGFPNAEVIVRTKRGIASAYIDGFKHIIGKNKYDYIVQMDAGMTHNPKDITRMLKKAELDGCDLVIGCRNVQEMPKIHWRTFLTKSAKLAVKLLGIWQSDVTSGFRCWKIDLLKKLDFDKVRSKGFSFQWELLYYCANLKANIGEITINYMLTNSSINRRIIVESLIMLSYYIFCVRYNPFKVR